MKVEHIRDAIKVTAQEYEGKPGADLIVQVLRGIVARAERYEALAKEEAGRAAKSAVTTASELEN